MTPYKSQHVKPTVTFGINRFLPKYHATRLLIGNSYMHENKFQVSSFVPMAKNLLAQSRIRNNQIYFQTSYHDTSQQGYSRVQVNQFLETYILHRFQIWNQKRILIQQFCVMLLSSGPKTTCHFHVCFSNSFVSVNRYLKIPYYKLC